MTLHLTRTPSLHPTKTATYMSSKVADVPYNNECGEMR